MGTAEPFPSSSQCLSLVSALLQETHSFPGEAETGFGLLHVSVPGLAQLSLPFAREMLETWLWDGGLCRAGLGISPKGRRGGWEPAHACVRSAWGYVADPLTTAWEAMSGKTNGNITGILCRCANLRVLAGQPYPSPAGVTLSPCPAGLGGGRSPRV